MMKLLLSVFLFSASFSTAQAASLTCLSPAQARTSYNACMQFLKFPLAKQKKVAVGAGGTLAQITNACKLQKSKGLKYMLANARKVCAYLDAERNQPPGFGSPYQPKAPLCSSLTDCRGGYCSAGNECSNGGYGSPCDNSSQCANGYCNGGGTCN